MAKLGSWPLSRTAVRGMYAGGAATRQLAGSRGCGRRCSVPAWLPGAE